MTTRTGPRASRWTTPPRVLRQTAHRQLRSACARTPATTRRSTASHSSRVQPTAATSGRETGRSQAPRVRTSRSRSTRQQLASPTQVGTTSKSRSTSQVPVVVQLAVQRSSSTTSTGRATSLSLASRVRVRERSTSPRRALRARTRSTDPGLRQTPKSRRSARSSLTAPAPRQRLHPVLLD